MGLPSSSAQLYVTVIRSFRELLSVPLRHTPTGSTTKTADAEDCYRINSKQEKQHSRSSVARGPELSVNHPQIPPRRLNCKHAVSLNSQQGEDASGIGSSIDVDSVRSDVGIGDGCMTVNNVLAEALVTRKKFITNPEQILFRLLRQRYPCSHTRMHKEKIAAGEFWS